MATPDQNASEKIGRAIDGQIFRLQDERRALLAAAVRIGQINDELAVLQVEKARIDPRRPPPSVINQGPPATTPVADDLPGRVR